MKTCHLHFLCNFLKSSYHKKDFPGNPVVKTLLPLQKVQAGSLVRELRSGMLTKFVIILQSAHISHHHDTHIKLIQFNVSNICIIFCMKYIY